MSRLVLRRGGSFFNQKRFLKSLVKLISVQNIHPSHLLPPVYPLDRVFFFPYGFNIMNIVVKGIG
jgi:hypothetical protein